MNTGHTYATCCTRGSALINKLIKGVAAVSLIYFSTASAIADTYSIKQQPMVDALDAFSRQSGLQLLFSSKEIGETTTRGINGELSQEQALTQLLAGTNLRYEYVSESTAVIKKITNSGPGVEGQKNNRVMDKKRSIREIEEMVVTAQKREQSAIEVPISVVAVSGEFVENAGIENLQDLAFAVPNLTVREEGPTRQFIAIRGLGNARGESSLVGIYLDEVPAAASPLGQIDLQAIDLERVEVLRGPSGSLYGQGSMGGTIRFITKDPSLDSVSGRVGGRIYSTHKGEDSGEFTGILNLPVIDDVFALRIAASYKDRGGWIDRADTGDKDINNNEITNIRVKGLWLPSEDLKINAMVVFHNNDGNGSNVVNVAPFSDSLVRSGAVPGLPMDYSDEYQIYNLTINYDLGFGALTSSTSLVDIQSQLAHRPQVYDNPAIQYEQGFGIDHENSVFAQELRLSGEAGRLNYTAGAFYRDYDTDHYTLDRYRLLNGVVLPPPDHVYSHVQQSSESISVFGELSYAFTDRLTIGIGTRYFEEDKEYDNLLNGDFFSGSFNNVSSRFNVSYAVNDDVNLYFNVGEGFRSGGFSPSAITLPKSYDSDELTSYDLGVKALLADGFYLELGVYYSEYDGAQSSISIPGEWAYLNSGDAEIKGVEWSMEWDVTDNFHLSFNGYSSDGEFVRIPDGLPDKNMVGDPLDYVPDYSYSINGDYAFNWQNDLPGYVRLTYNKQGEIFSIHRALSVVESPVARSEPVGFLNGSIGMQWKSVELELFARNLLDEDMPTNAALNRVWAQYRPRSVGLRLNYDF